MLIQLGLVSNLVILIVFIKFNLYEIYYFVFQFNNIMIVFNILPIYPLDGYRILENLLSNIYEEVYLNDLLNVISLIMLVILLIFIIISKSIALLIIYVFLVYKFILNFITTKKKKKIDEILKSNYFYFFR